MQALFNAILLGLSQKDDSRTGRVIYWAWAGLLWLAGGLAWGKFLNWGRGPFEFHDWAEITMPRLLFLRDAAQRGLAPLHIADPFTLGGITDRYMSVPDVYLSPQYLLLGWMDTGTFILFNFLLLYTVGFAGLLWLGRMNRLSPVALTALVMLFNFNGHMLGHVSIGHFTWNASFLLPWLLGMIFRLMEGQGGWKWVLKVAALMLVMLLQGGYHQFIWSLFLLALLIPAAPRHFSTLARALVFSVLLSAVRILPAALNLGIFDNRFVGGYPFARSIWAALTDVYVPNDYAANQGLTQTIGTWEYSLYLGFAATLFVLGFGVVKVFRNRDQPGSHVLLLLPALGLAVLSIDSVYQYLRAALPLPLFTGERVASRILFMAFLLALALAAIEFQRWLDKEKNLPVVILSSVMFALVIANDLWQNFHLWRIPVAAEKFGLFPAEPARWVVTNHSDPLYTNVLWIGLLISLATLAGLIWATVRVERSQAQLQAQADLPARSKKQNNSSRPASGNAVR